MHEACTLIFKVTSGFKPLIACTVIAALNAVNPVYAQLPPTNMGQFVHQPGDNQYTNQTQAERHGAVMVPASSAVAPAAAPSSPNVAYRPTPAAPKPDISLLPIVADEPIKPAGFPPLPDRLDLPTPGAGVWTSNGGPGSNGANGTVSGGTTTMDNGISREAQGIHQHYVHYQAGAFMPNQAVQQNPYRPSNSDYYNVNPGAKAGMAAGTQATSAAAVETPSMQALKRMGSEPLLAPDKVTKPEAPEAVTVNQSVTQDLSLPEDDFNKHYPTAINNNPTQRAANGTGRMLVYPLRSLMYSGAGMAVGAASMAGMYAIRR